MAPAELRSTLITTVRHRTSWIEAGPTNGPLMIFVHGWPELGLFWRAQIEHFAAAGWRCIAPDMRGYGASSVPESTGAYAVRELVNDMVELHDAVGGSPAIWVGHDWGSAVVWAMAAHHSERCRGTVSLCIPYLARGMTLPNLASLVDHTLYPEAIYPVGQWDYWLFYREHFAQAAQDFEADIEATLAGFVQPASLAAVSQPSRNASVRARGGYFGEARRAPAAHVDTMLLNRADFETWVAAFRVTGFSGANAWYLNDAANLDYSAEAARFGRLVLPTLFLHAARDVTCQTIDSQLCAPMRADCANLTEIVIDGGHELMLERPAEVNEAIANWLSTLP